MGGKDYPADYLAMPSEKAAAAREANPELQPAPPPQPRDLEAYGVRSGDPVALARYLIDQRSGNGQNLYSLGPRRVISDCHPSEGFSKNRNQKPVIHRVTIGYYPRSAPPAPR